MSDRFRKFSVACAHALGRPWAFFVALASVLIWAVTGPYYEYSNTWQLIINTGTTILTFLMVFLIQNTQNRDAEAIHLKLDELIRAVDAARNNLVNLDELTDAEIEKLKQEFVRLGHDFVPSAPKAKVKDIAVQAAQRNHKPASKAGGRNSKSTKASKRNSKGGR